MNQELIEQVAQVAIAAAKSAGIEIKRMRDAGGFSVQEKADRSLLTSADLAAQEIVIAHITKHFSNHTIISEELPNTTLARDLMGELVWVIDPIDGTSNYAYGLLDCAVSIGFASQGRGIFGVVNNPFTNECFTATRGAGALLNGKPIKVRAHSSITDGLVATGFPPLSQRTPEEIKLINKILAVAGDIRRAGACSLDLCSVACGRVDAYYESVKPWDVAAGGLIAREAGAIVGHYLPNKYNFPEELNGVGIYACTPAVVQDLRSIIEP